MPLKQSKLKAREKNLEDFLPLHPAFMIKPKKDKGIDGITFNPDAVGYMSLNKLDTDGKSLLDKLVFIDNYSRTGEEQEGEELVFHVTKEKEIEWGKKHKSCQFYSGTKSITSKTVYDTLVAKYNLDTNLPHYFILERSNDPDEQDVYFINLHQTNEEIFDKGENLKIELEKTYGIEENTNV